MKKMLFVSACVFAMSTGGAFAQNQPAPGASSKGNAGPGATNNMTDTRKGMTTGSSTTRRHEMRNTNGPAANPSSEGNVGPGTNNLRGPQPGGR
jgi:hypothetical protein